jgi:hypothetical protein
MTQDETKIIGDVFGTFLPIWYHSEKIQINKQNLVVQSDGMRLFCRSQNWVPPADPLW